MSPLTKKGRKIMKAMQKTYKSKKKAKKVFYSSQSKGTITGTHKKRTSHYRTSYYLADNRSWFLNENRTA